MLCINGKELIPEGETGLYFMCQIGYHKGRPCPWARICGITGRYIMASHQHGGMTCADYSIEPVVVEQKIELPELEEKPTKTISSKKKTKVVDATPEIDESFDDEDYLEK